MSIDGAAGDVINQIGFENDFLAVHIQRKQSQPR
jgi:hypothetical protein